jgi:hypothetical protein
MARKKLSKEQREQVLTWIAADYDTQLIRQWMEKREWPKIGRNTLYIYRRRYATKIEELRKQRLSLALTTGLALKEERVTRLKDEADLLEAKKWEYDWNSGRLWNEKAWRETLEQIAEETEDRKGKPVFPSEITVTFKRSDEQKAGD